VLDAEDRHAAGAMMDAKAGRAVRMTKSAFSGFHLHRRALPENA
jgi:hypothetical protein